MADERQPASDLDQRASVAGLRRLLRGGAIDGAQFAALRDRLLTPERWLALARTALLGIGAALVVAGTIYLFAFNWAALGRFTKLASVAAAIAGCVVAAAVRGRTTLTGKVLTTVAAMLVGVFLAVFGQIYQTGADAYDLFVGWAALILPWVLAAEFTALWVIWFLLVNAAVLLYWEQVAKPEGQFAMTAVFGVLAAIDAGLLTLREYFARRGVAWLQETWARYVALALVLYLLTLPVLHWVFDGRRDDTTSAMSLGIWIAGIAALAAASLRFVPDILALSLIATDVCIVIDCMLGHALLDHGGDEVLAMFVLALVTLGMFVGATLLLRALHGRLANRRQAT